MMTPDPINELERAYQNAHRGLEETVAYYQELRDDVLSFLLPYHPEMEGVLQVGNGSGLTFVLWKVLGENMVPIFTSPQRVEEALKAANKWHERSSMGEMLGKELLHLISLLPDKPKAIINPGCCTGSRIMTPEIIESVLDGSALHLPTPGEIEMGKLIIPGIYRLPETLLFALGQFFTNHPVVRAAWLFRDEADPDREKQTHVIGLETTGELSAALATEIVKLAESAGTPQPCRLWLLDAKDEFLAKLMRDYPTFYKAPDYSGPNTATNILSLKARGGSPP